MTAEGGVREIMKKMQENKFGQATANAVPQPQFPANQPIRDKETQIVFRSYRPVFNFIMPDNTRVSFIQRHLMLDKTIPAEAAITKCIQEHYSNLVSVVSDGPLVEVAKKAVEKAESAKVNSGEAR
jgi:hypothetical protein